MGKMGTGLRQVLPSLSSYFLLTEEDCSVMFSDKKAHFGHFTGTFPDRISLSEWEGMVGFSTLNTEHFSNQVFGYFPTRTSSLTLAGCPILHSVVLACLNLVASDTMVKGLSPTGLPAEV